jgi:hypothetical protein
MVVTSPWMACAYSADQVIFQSGCCRPDGREPAKARGKSGLQRAHCQITPGRCHQAPTDSATENRPPMAVDDVDGSGKGETVG